MQGRRGTSAGDDGGGGAVVAFSRSHGNYARAYSASAGGGKSVGRLSATEAAAVVEAMFLPMTTSL
jgi:hypothetical protein